VTRPSAQQYAMSAIDEILT